jgi:glycine hydroxymethyltransferase
MNAILRSVPRVRAPLASRCLATAARTEKLSHLLDDGLSSLDPEVFDVIEREKCRQRTSLTLIPSENYTSRADGCVCRFGTLF